MIMHSLATKNPEELEQFQKRATARFAPEFLRAALQRLSKLHGEDELDKFERAMIELVEGQSEEEADFSVLKEFAIEQLYQVIREAKESPDTKQRLEDIAKRRTSGRSEEARTLEEQLQSGLEDSFPASDPPAVVSSTISGAREKHKQ
jgi:type II secretory pathway component PulJ